MASAKPHFSTAFDFLAGVHPYGIGAQASLVEGEGPENQCGCRDNRQRGVRSFAAAAGVACLGIRSWGYSCCCTAEVPKATVKK